MWILYENINLSYFTSIYAKNCVIGWRGEQQKITPKKFITQASKSYRLYSIPGLLEFNVLKMQLFIVFFLNWWILKDES